MILTFMFLFRSLYFLMTITGHGVRARSLLLRMMSVVSGLPMHRKFLEYEYCTLYFLHSFSAGDLYLCLIYFSSGPISDVDEAAALNYGFQNTSIYSCSWGPADDGRSMEGPSYLIQKAVVNGIQNGRGGKGSIFVFASGNGAAQGDQCNFDGYTNSIYSVTVAAIDYKGLHPYYSESCAAVSILGTHHISHG